MDHEEALLLLRRWCWKYNYLLQVAEPTDRVTREIAKKFIMALACVGEFWRSYHICYPESVEGLVQHLSQPLSVNAAYVLLHRWGLELEDFRDSEAGAPAVLVRSPYFMEQLAAVDARLRELAPRLAQ
jgi:hypothetical protein